MLISDCNFWAVQSFLPCNNFGDPELPFQESTVISALFRNGNRETDILKTQKQTSTVKKAVFTVLGQLKLNPTKPDDSSVSSVPALLSYTSISFYCFVYTAH